MLYAANVFWALRPHIHDRMPPVTRCQTPHVAATSAIPPMPLKNVNINTSPKPEFWTPVSKVMVLMSAKGKRNTHEKR